MDYEKGVPRNLVQFSEYNDLAFTDTGVQINDNSKPSKNVIWSSEKIEQRLNELAAQADMNGNMGGGNISVAGPAGSGLNLQLPMGSQYGYYPNGYKRYVKPNMGQGHRIFRVLRPSWWLSFIIPKRAHYCDKCCNYMSHTWSTAWNDDPSLANNKCNCSSGCNSTTAASGAQAQKCR